MINVLLLLFNTAGIKFSTRHNALYGVKEFVAMLTKMAELATTATTAARTLEHKNMPSAKWFLDMMHSIPIEDMEKLCKDMLAYTTDQAREAGYLDNVRIYAGIDKHLISRYDRIIRWLIRAMRKNGTNKFEVYATVQAVGHKVNITLGCFRFIRGEHNVDFIREFIQTLDEQRIKTRALLLDREFFAVDVMKLIHKMKRKFIMPAKKTPGIIRAIEQYHKGKRKAVSRYTVKNKNGDCFEFTLLIKRKSREELARLKKKKKKGEELSISEQYIVFATNIPVKDAVREMCLIPKAYRLRWGIETGYKQIEEIRPWTTSRDEAYRMLLFHVSVFMLNMWALERVKKGVNPREMTLRTLVEATARIIVSQIANIPTDRGGGT